MTTIHPDTAASNESQALDLTHLIPATQAEGYPNDTRDLLVPALHVEQIPSSYTNNTGTYKKGSQAVLTLFCVSYHFDTVKPSQPT